MGLRIVIKYPTRGRPRLFFKTLGLYRRMLRDPRNARFVVSIDEDDPMMNTSEVIRRIMSMPEVECYVGNSKTKIQAVNANFDRLDPYEILILASDDMIPVVPGYDREIRKLMQEHLPNLDGCLHFDDGFNHNNLNTMPIIGREVLQRWGYIYHPAYISEWCDNEFQEVLERAGKSVRIPRVLFRHDWTKATGQDATYRKNSGFHNRDHQTFLERKSAGFP